jgi:hypothetical protein
MHAWKQKEASETSETRRSHCLPLHLLPLVLPLPSPLLQIRMGRREKKVKKRKERKNGSERGRLLYI